MAEPVSETIDSAVETVNVANIKTVAEMAAWTAAMSMQNQVAHQNRLNILAESLVGQVSKGINEVDPIQAISVLKATTGNDVAAQLSALLASLASGQQGVKTAQTTPPVTP